MLHNMYCIDTNILINELYLQSKRSNKTLDAVKIVQHFKNHFQMTTTSYSSCILLHATKVSEDVSVCFIAINGVIQLHYRNFYLLRRHQSAFGRK